MDVDLRLLRSFVALAEDLHFTGAAARLRISQPALSKQIDQLERQLGQSLVVRTSRKVGLTAAGAALLPSARDLLARWSQTQIEVRQATYMAARTFRVGFIAHAAAELTAKFFDAFTGLHPDWRIALSQAPWTDPTSGLLDGDVDAALLRLPIAEEDVINTQVIFTEERCVIMSVNHPLATQEVVRFSQLLDEPFVALPASTGVWRDYWLAIDHRDGRPPVIGTEVKTSDEWMEAVANNFGICLTGTSTARFYPRPDIVCRPIDKITPTSVAVAWRRDDKRSVVADFVRCCERVASDAGHLHQ